MAAFPAHALRGFRRPVVVVLCFILLLILTTGLISGVSAAQNNSTTSATVTANDITGEDHVAGERNVRTISVEVTNASASASVQLDDSEWPGEIHSIRSDRGKMNADSQELNQRNETLEFKIESTYVTDPNEGVDGELTVVLKDTETLDDSSVDVNVKPLGLDPAFADSGPASFGEDAMTTLDGASLRHELGDEVIVSSPDLSDEELFAVFNGDTQQEYVDRRPSEDGIRVSEPEASRNIDVSFRDVDAATYRFNFTAPGSEVVQPKIVEVTDPEIDGTFNGPGADRHEVAAGDMVTVDISLSNTDGAYLLVGADHKASEGDPTNIFDILYVEGGEVTINTRLLGTDVDPDEIYQSEGTVKSYLHNSGDLPEELEDVRFRDEDGHNTYPDLTTFRDALSMSPQPWPVQPERYRFVLGADGTVEVREDGIADFEYPVARSNLQLTQPGVESMETYVAPRDPANDPDREETVQGLREEMTQREAVAKEDRLVIEVNATGIYGALHYFSDEQAAGFEEGLHPRFVQALLDTKEGVIIEALQTDMKSNEPRTALDFGGATDGELYFLPYEDESTERIVEEQFYLIVDTRDAGAFDGSFSEGESDEFEFNYGYESPPDERYRFINNELLGRPAPFDPDPAITEDGTEHYPYLPTDAVGETKSAPFTIEESYAEYDQTTNQGQVALTNGTEVTLTGETNVAPASEFYIQIVADDRTNPTRITIDDVEVDEDGSFEATKDLSELRVSEGVEVEFYAEDRIVDKRGGVLAGNRSTPSRFDIVEAPGRVTAGTADSVTIESVINNTGAATETKPVTLRVGDAEVDSVSRTLDGGENRSVELDAGSLEEGTYRYVLSTPDDEAVGELVVGRDAPMDVVDTENTGADEEEPGANDDAADEGDDSGDDTAEDDGTAADEDESDGDDGGDDPGLPSEVVGLLGAFAGAIGAEHAVGGAAVVGAAHVLGYWV